MVAWLPLSTRHLVDNKRFWSLRHILGCFTHYGWLIGNILCWIKRLKISDIPQMSIIAVRRKESKGQTLVTKGNQWSIFKILKLELMSSWCKTKKQKNMLRSISCCMTFWVFEFFNCLDFRNLYEVVISKTSSPVNLMMPF